MWVFWSENKGGEVRLRGLGKIGKKKAFENVQKRLKIYKKSDETFENIQKLGANI